MATIIYDAKDFEVQTAKLIQDDDVEKKSGIYSYLLTHNESDLGIRTFTDSVKQKVYEKQKGICPICKKHLKFKKGKATISYRGIVAEKQLKPTV